MAVFKKTYPLRWHLLTLVLASMIPFFVLAAIMVNWLVDLERTASERRLVQASQQLATLVEQEIESTARTLDALSVSVYAKALDLQEYHSELGRLLKIQPWINILVHSPDGAVKLSANVKFGQGSAPVETDSLKRVFATGKPATGGVARGRRGRFGFPVRVPVYRDGQLIYALTAVIPVNDIQNMVASSSLPEEWTRTIVDSQGLIAARSRDPEAFVGKPAPDSFSNLLADRDQKVFRGQSLDGEDVYLSVARVPSSEWVAVVAVPFRVLEAQAKRSLSIVFAVGALLLLTFGSIAVYYSRQLTQRIQSVARGAKVLVEGQIPEMERSSVSEVEQLRQSLITAAGLLESRERERNDHLEEANAARREAETANLAKSQFLANMSHELRTPLAVVLGFADLLAHDDEMSAEEREENIDILSRNGKHLTRLIDDILDLSKVEASKLSLEFSEFSPERLLESVVAELRQQAVAKGVELVLTYEASTPSVMKSDPVRLRQILFNILGNAVKFTDRGRVEMNVSADAQRVYFTVKDTGIGLSAEQQKLLFKPFSQADGSHTRKYGGTGLGLALSRKIAVMLGGDIQILESQTGKGSTFLIQLLIVPEG